MYMNEWLMCPYCLNVNISYDSIYDEWDYRDGFEMKCPDCQKVIEVEVIPTPDFKLHRKEK